MTISSQICKRIYQADGENRQWAVDFPYLSITELKVYCTNNTGVETEVTAQCTFDEVEQEIIYPTIASEQDPLPVGYMVTIVRTTTPTQTIHLTQQGTLDASVLEKGFDKLTLHVQELIEQSSRSIKYPVSSNKTDADAQTFLAELQTTQNTALASALASVAASKSSLEQTVADEAVARAQADTILQTTINSKQNVLSTDQQNAVNSGVTSAKISSYDTHILNTNNPHSVTKAQVGLENVDNTADTDKPISTAMQTALNGKQNTLTTVQQAAVNSGVTSSTVTQVQTNKEDIAALDAELDESRPWQKPADWIDIRSGALPNSIYYLVGHSADYTTYPTVDLYATVSNSGTYDVYIDGIKKVSAVASGTVTTITWQTLALTSGWNVTHPSALRTHIVRITPSSDSNKFLFVGDQNLTRNGIMWAHFTTNYAIDMTHALRNIALLEAVTTSTGSLLVNGCGNAFRTCPSLVECPVLEGNNTQVNMYYSFYESNALKKVSLKNIIGTSGTYTFWAKGIEKIDFENSTIFVENGTFRESKIKSLPPISVSSSTPNILYITYDCLSLENTVLDLTNATSAKRIHINSSGASKRVDGLKGVTISNEAPLNGNSPQLDVSYTGLDRAALVNLFNSMPTVSASQVCNVTGCTGASSLDETDLAIATAKGWTITR